MAVFQGNSNLPEDRFINVFHFFSIGAIDYATAATAITTQIEGFYIDPTGLPSGLAPCEFLSPWISRSWQVITYDLTTAQPRVPSTTTLTLPAGDATGIPEEVAVCLSLRGAPPLSPRRRGRLYFGPLSARNTAIIASTSANRARVDLSGTGVGTVLCEAANRLKDESATAGVPWCIRSTRPTENFVIIDSGYVDDAADTQRRRGPDPLNRVTFS